MKNYTIETNTPANELAELAETVKLFMTRLAEALTASEDEMAKEVGMWLIEKVPHVTLEEALEATMEAKMGGEPGELCAAEENGDN